MAGNSIVNMFKVKELRNRLLFTLAVLAIYRLGCVLTIPGIDAQGLNTLKIYYARTKVMLLLVIWTSLSVVHFLTFLCLCLV